MSRPCDNCDGEGAYWEESTDDEGLHIWLKRCDDCAGTGEA